MYFRFDCVHCGKSLRIREEDAGRKAHCPYCRKQIRVPDSPGAAAAPAGGAAPAESAPAARTVAQAAPQIAPRGRQAGEGGASDGTNVNAMLSGAIALAATFLFYLLLLPAKRTPLGDLFYARGWVPPLEVFLMMWSAAILVLKYRKLSAQKESMLFDLLSSRLGEEITPENVNQFDRHVRDLPTRPRESFLITRVLRGLEHYRVRNSASEVATILSSQSEIDSNAVQSSYTLLKVFIWAIPILGFIGTVQGLGVAVGGFAGNLDKAQDVATLKNSLGQTTSGLAVAFDTTFIALIMSLLLMIPASSLQKSEEDLLNWVDEYCNENLLKRLRDSGGPGLPNDKELIRAAIAAAMGVHHAELQTWRDKLEAIGSTVTRQVADGWNAMHEHMRYQHEQSVSQLAAAAGEVVDRQLANLREIDSISQKVSSLQREQMEQLKLASEVVDQQLRGMEQRARSHQELLEQQMGQAIQRSWEGLVQADQRSQSAHAEAASTMRQAAEHVQRHFTALDEALRSLNKTLGELGGKQVVIQAPPRRSWWSRRRGDGGG